jgi:hypothetical protein
MIESYKNINGEQRKERKRNNISRRAEKKGIFVYLAFPTEVGLEAGDETLQVRDLFM